MKSIQQVVRKYFSSLSLLLLLLVFILTNLGILWIFNNYLSELRNKENQAIASLVEDTLGDSFLDMTEIRMLRQRANQSGIQLILISDSNEILFDSSLSGNGIRKPVLSRRNTVLDIEKLSYTTMEVSVKNDRHVKVRVGRERRWLAGEEDLSFVVGINVIFLIVLIIALFMVWLFSRYLAEKIASPIIDMQKATNIIKRGAYKSLGPLNSDTKELNDLADEIKSLAFQLDNQEKLRKRLTTDIAHELRSPLSVIRSQIEAMMDHVLEPSEERLGKLNGEIMRITKLIDDINELSVIENDLYQLKKDKINLSEIILNASDDFKLIFEAKGLSLEAHLEEGIYINGDSERIRQVVNNLLSNAYKYTDIGGVKVGLEKLENEAVISIKDTGMGMSDKDLPFIFERFYRSDLSRSRKTGGAGIGLAIVKKIIEAHGASIDVTSKEGKGTIFIIKIPLE